jgi:hypothetical protein
MDKPEEEMSPEPESEYAKEERLVTKYVKENVGKTMFEILTELTTFGEAEAKLRTRACFISIIQVMQMF